MNKVVGVCNLIKNFDNLSDISRILEIECLLVSLKTDDSLVNGLFRFVADIADQGTIKLNNILNLTVAAAEKYLNVPLSNAYNFARDLFKGKSVKKYLMPLIIDLASLAIPSLQILNIINGIVKGIQSLFTKQSIKNVSSIDMVCTDTTKFKWFRKSHKVSYTNEFFGINVTYNCKHSSDAKKLCEAEVKRQLDSKVYQVMGIPIEFINGEIETPTTRIGIYRQKYYLEDLENEWLYVNGKYLTRKQKDGINKMYFESQSDKEYRYELAKEGKAPSWYWSHKNDNIIDFTKSVYKMIQKEYKILSRKYQPKNIIDNIDIFVKLVKRIYAKIFNLKTIKVDLNLEKTENDYNFKTFEDAKSHRNKNDNKILNNTRNKNRLDYNNESGMYDRMAIIDRALNNLWKTQQSLDYILQTSLSTIIGSTGSFLSYIDYEVVSLLHNPVTYIFKKIINLADSMIQGYITRVLVDQSCLYFSLLEYSELMTDDYLHNFINPMISCGIGITVSLTKHILDLTNKDKSILNVCFNASVSAINTSFGMIYSYLKTTSYAAYCKFPLFNKLMTKITFTLNHLFKLGLAVDTVTAISLAFVFNFGIRCGTKLYNSIKSFLDSKPVNRGIEFYINPIVNDIEKNYIVDIIYNSKINEIELNPTKNDLEINPIINDLDNTSNNNDMESNNNTNIKTNDNINSELTSYFKKEKFKKTNFVKNKYSKIKSTRSKFNKNQFRKRKY